MFGNSLNKDYFVRQLYRYSQIVYRNSGKTLPETGFKINKKIKIKK